LNFEVKKRNEELGMLNEKLKSKYTSTFIIHYSTFDIKGFRPSSFFISNFSFLISHF